MMIIGYGSIQSALGFLHKNIVMNVIILKLMKLEMLSWFDILRNNDIHLM